MKLIRILAVFSCLFLVTVLAAGCAQSATTETTAPETTVPEIREETVPETTVETEPQPTVPADGDPSNITCKGSYTFSDEDVLSAKDAIVATMGNKALTNSQLQVYYWMEVAQYLEANPGVVFDQPLDTIPCDLDETAITMQQYFLQRAVTTWQNHMGLVCLSKDVDLPTEEDYKPDLEQHEEYFDPNIPAAQYLYGYYHKNYRPNEMHQEYLDNLPQMLLDMAVANGYADLAAMTQDLAGAGATQEDLLYYSDLMNQAYMYFTMLTYYIEPTAEDVESYYLLHQAEYTEQGITQDSGKLVNFRTMLLLPKSDSQEDWDKCLKEAQNLQGMCMRKGFQYDDFAELAYDYSQDPGSNINGGLYSKIHQGQLCGELDSWIFDPSRVAGDSAVIKTKDGYHVVWYQDDVAIWYEKAQDDLIAQMCRQILEETWKRYPGWTNYSGIRLGLAPQEGNVVSSDAILYADVAHERFPSAPLYLQRDYPDTMYGKYRIYTHGCGITTMAMLASYLTDEEWTPPELCALYGRYNTRVGTDLAMMDEVPAELGFDVQGSHYNWPETWQTIENGQVVVNLQYAGYWTRGGHFLLIQEVRDDDLLVIRDSNILNYAVLSGHQIDAHEKSTVTANGSLTWYFAPKVTRIPACARCAEQEEVICDGIFSEDYICHKCEKALARRDGFLAACDAMQ